MRLVLDTNVVASAMLWGGGPKLLLQAGREKRVELYTSLPLLAELTDILSRRKFEKKIAASMLAVDQLVDHYAELAGVVRPMPITSIAPDPDDDVVIVPHSRPRPICLSPGIGYCSQWPSIKVSGSSVWLRRCG